MLLLSYLSIVRPRSLSLSEIINRTQELYENGDFLAVESVYKEFQKDFSDNQLFQKEYLSFLLKTGQYDEILEVKNIPKAAQSIAEKAKLCKQKLRSRNPKEIEKLIDISPNCFDILFILAQFYLQEGDFDLYRKYAMKLEQLSLSDENRKQFAKLRAIHSSYTGDYTSSVRFFEEAGINKIAKSIASLQEKLRDISESQSSLEAKMRGYKGLCKEITVKKVGDYYTPSIYEKFLVNALIEYIQLGVDNMVSGLYAEAKQLYDSDTKMLSRRKSKLVSKTEEKPVTPDVVFLVIRAFFLDGKVKEGKELMDKHSKVLGEHRNEALQNMVAEAEERMRRERERREQERRRKESKQQEEEEYYRRQQAAASVSHEYDYYKILGVEKNATLAELKKARRKRLRELAKKAQTEGKEDQEQEQLVNKAYDVLSDEEQRRAYDMGPQESGGYYQKRSNRGGRMFGGANEFYVDEDFGNIFDTFFGGGRRGGRRSRQQYYYYTF